MKRFVSIFLVLFVSVSSSFATDEVVNVTYGSKYHTYFCSQPLEASGLFMYRLDGATYYVYAYCPSDSIIYIIQFAKYKDAVDFCQQYVSITNSLRKEESYARLDEISVSISKLVNKYAPRYYPDWDFYEDSMGTLCRHASPVYGLQ